MVYFYFIGSTLSANLSSLNVIYLSQFMNSSIEQNNNMNSHKDFDYKYEYELLQNSVQSNEFNSLAFSTPTSNISKLNIWENKNDKWNHSFNYNMIPYNSTISYNPNPLDKNQFVEIQKDFPIINTSNYIIDCNCSFTKLNFFQYFLSTLNQLQYLNMRYNLLNLYKWYQFYYEQYIQNIMLTMIETNEKPLDLSLKTDLILNKSICQQQQEEQQELPSEQLTQSNKTINESLKIHCNSSTYLLYDKHLENNDHLIQANIINMPYSNDTLTKISSNDYSIYSSNFISEKSLNKLKNYSLNITNKLLSPCKNKKINNHHNHPLSTNQLYLNKSIKHSYTQNELSEAVKAICFGQLGTRKAANLYGIPRSTLRNKICKLNELKKLEEKRLGGKSIVLSQFLLNLIEFNKLYQYSIINNNNNNNNNNNGNNNDHYDYDYYNNSSLVSNSKGQITKLCLSKNYINYLMNTANRVASIFQVNCRRSYMYKRTLDHKSKNGVEKSVHTKKKLASIRKLRCSHQQPINQ
ncbi:unnamed protein product [Schistosoma margrebowiei]|uniref:HTH psq-type domain-containing protein n=1 Tax=Schistosoma margrebowiei TaxID=48269 RepID=A0AA85A8R4_9TREM|nr:unnamed protein product [Schistosoma margrebowiei]